SVATLQHVRGDAQDAREDLLGEGGGDIVHQEEHEVGRSVAEGDEGKFARRTSIDIHQHVGRLYQQALPLLFRSFEYIHSTKDPVRGQAVATRKSYHMQDYPAELQKKMLLMKYFRDYMAENLIKASYVQGGDEGPRKNLDFLTKYLRTKNGVMFRLSNRVLQVCGFSVSTDVTCTIVDYVISVMPTPSFIFFFFCHQINFFDHTKIIISEDATVVSYIDKKRQLSTYRLEDCFNGDEPELVSRLKYAKDILGELIERRTGSPASAKKQGVGK
ncbi:hypothetical protein BC936DRAFT_144288, partial [Jimgerdemannia flammicorona]